MNSKIPNNPANTSSPTTSSTPAPQTNTTTPTANPAAASGTPEQSSRLQLPSTSIVPGLARDIQIGEVINFVVRGKTHDGLGLLYMLGQLVKAKIPDHLKTGDKVQAKIERQGEQLIFKVLELSNSVSPTTSSASSSANSNSQLTPLMSVPDRIKRDVTELLIKLGPLISAEPHQGSPQIKNLSMTIDSLLNKPSASIQSLANELQKLLPSAETLLNSTKLSSALQLLSQQNHPTPSRSPTQPQTTTLTSSLQNLITQLQQALITGAGTPESRFIAQVNLEIGNLISNINSPDFDKQATLLLRVLSQEAATETLGKTPSKNAKFFDTIKSALTELESAINQSGTEKKPKLGRIQSLLQQHYPDLSDATQSKNLTAELSRELRALTSTLEQLVQIQDNFRQLEPIMRMMQAPEFILFPFLFGSFMGVAEVTIDPDAHRRKSNENLSEEDKSEDKDNESEEKEKSKKVSRHTKYSATIPLPHLGSVSLVSLQQEGSINISFHVPDSEKQVFLESRLGELRDALAKEGLSKSEIQIHSQHHNDIPSVGEVVISDRKDQEG